MSFLRPRDSELYPLRHGLYFAFFNALNWQVGAGAPTVLLMEQLGADSFQVGLVYAWAFLLTPVQVLATVFLPRLGFKRLTLAGWGARGWFLLVPLGLTVLAPRSPSAWMIYAMVTAMAGYSFSRSFGNAAIANWFYVLVPSEIRGRYWSTDQLMGATAAVGSLLLSAGLFSVLPAYPAFAVQYAIAIVGATLACRSLARLPDVGRPGTLTLGFIATETRRLLLAPSAFRTYLAMAVLLFVTTTPMLPFGVYYLKATAGVSSSRIMIFTMLYYLGVVGACLGMRSRMDQLGSRPFFRICFATYGVVAVGWLAVLTTGWAAAQVLPALFLLMGLAFGCWTSANLHYLAEILPEDDRTLPLSIHGAVIAFCGGVSPVIWGVFLKGRGTEPSVSVPVFGGFFCVVIASSALLYALTGWLVRSTPASAVPGEAPR